MISRGCAGGMQALLTLMLIFVNYTILTKCRSIGPFKRNCLVFTDKKIWLHRFCGFGIFWYAVIHSISHMCGSIRTVATADL